jgi:hypothetical protein
MKMHLTIVALAAGFIGTHAVSPEADSTNLPATNGMYDCDVVVPSQAEEVQETQDVAESTVRLRKLHLVRPDLIPYPLAIDTYC